MTQTSHFKAIFCWSFYGTKCFTQLTRDRKNYLWNNLKRHPLVIANMYLTHSTEELHILKRVFFHHHFALVGFPVSFSRETFQIQIVFLSAPQESANCPAWWEIKLFATITQNIFIPVAGGTDWLRSYL